MCFSVGLYGSDGPVYRMCVERSSLDNLIPDAPEGTRRAPTDDDFPYKFVGGTDEIPVEYLYCIEDGCNANSASGFAPLAVAIALASALVMRV